MARVKVVVVAIIPVVVAVRVYENGWLTITVDESPLVIVGNGHTATGAISLLVMVQILF